MKAIISVFIFSLCFSAVSARDESLSEAVRLYKQGSFAEAIPLFEKNSDLKGQSRINRIRLAECYLYRDDLVLPEKKDSIFRREELLQRIKDNYAQAAFIFSSEITEIEKITPQRPMTHDLLKNVINELGGYVQRVLVTELRDNTFYAVIEVRVNGSVIYLDSRPSDAIALALRVDCPIYVRDEVLQTSHQHQLEPLDDDLVTDEDVEWPEEIGDMSDYKM
ncbi:MAG TPA: bifunctional nuclease family protein [Leptospiraceae bacterium]|nr:bifunctional nuclease family protein [Leptospiraceae bacterium]